MPARRLTVIASLALTLATGCTSASSTGPVTSMSSTPTSAASSAEPSGPAPTARPVPTASPAAPQGSIVFNVEFGLDGGTHKSIYTIRPDGSGFRMLTNAPTGFNAEPAWTTDGRVVYVIEDPKDVDVSHLYRMDAMGGNRTQLTSGAGYVGGPAVSPDGRWIAFSFDPVDGPASIHLARIDGSHATAITTPPAGAEDGDWFPTFSPDGSQVAFQRDHALEVVNVDGTGLRQILPATAGVWRPRWSPDGRLILFEVQGDGPLAGHLETVDLAGAGSSAKVTDLGRGGGPDWSPDGRFIVFQRWLEGTAHIGLVVANADGTHPVEIWRTPEKTDIFIAGSDWGSPP